MSLKNIDHIFAAVESFPTMPAAGTRMLQIMEDPDSGLDRIEEVLRYDPGLTANLLKLANSAYFGMPGKVGSVRQAVILLGLKRLAQLVIATCVTAVMRGRVAGYDLPPGDLWRHSIAVAIASEALMKGTDGSGYDIFTPALLHDIGKLVLGQFVKEDLAEIDAIVAKGIPAVIAESMVLGVDHAEIGARILQRWSFPEPVVDAVRWHHDPEGFDRADPKVDVVYLANLLCQASGVCSTDGQNATELSPVVIERMGIEMSRFEPISCQIADWVDELSDALVFN